MEETRAFLEREAQIVGAQLHQLTPGAQPGQGQLRVLAGDDEQMELRRLVGDQRLDGFVHGGGVDGVKIVQHQQEFSRQRQQLVGEYAHEHLDGRRVGGGQGALHRLPDRGGDLLQRGDEGS